MSSPLRRIPSLLPAALLAGFVLFSSPTASAQGVCFGPDGLTGPCCTPVTPNLPPFPGVETAGLGICWNNCTVAVTQQIFVNWTPPTEVTCAEYVTQLTVVDGVGTPIMVGTLVLDYTRTWDELSPSGETHQVWRFAAKADLRSANPGGLPLCPLPSCLPPFGNQETAFFYGYADYACLDLALPFEPVLVLYHACDRFIHNPALSDRPGVYHPGSSYAIAVPHTAVQPFIPANSPAPAGAVITEATRDMGPITPPPFICIAEDPVVQGDMFRAAVGCICNFSPTTTHHTLRIFQGTTACLNPVGLPGGWASVAVSFPMFPWFHLVSSSIGFWSNPAAYPGKERAWVDEGIFVHQSACTGDWADMKYGGTTRAGWEVLLPIPEVLNKFTDLADNYSVPLAGPAVPPILGSIRPTDRLIYVNYK